MLTAKKHTFFLKKIDGFMKFVYDAVDVNFFKNCA
jgi:hypothetical protein